MKAPLPARATIWMLGPLPLLLLFTGCVASKYQAARDYPLPVALHLTAAAPPIEATVHSVITYHGSGSWKRDAYWDEYIVSITNHGDRPVTLLAAELTDFRGDASSPGVDSWLLEKQSLTRRDEINRAAKMALVQFGGGYLAFGTAGSVLFLGGGAAAYAMTIGAIPIYAATAVVRNRTHRHDIETGFAERRLVLPATIPPGRSAHGSLFFRIAPSPISLALHGRAQDDPYDLTIDLTPLGPLHLSQPAPASRSGLSASLPRRPASG